MKSLIVVSTLIVVSAVISLGQAPFGGGAGGGRGVGGVGGQGRGAGPQGGRGAPAQAAAGPIADMVTKFTDAVNKRDAAALNKLVTADCVLIDEDGHFDPVSQWITKLTSTGAKTLTVLGGRGLSPLRVSESGDTAWAAFNYNLKETVTPRGQTTASPNEIDGIATIVFKKNGADWQAIMIHVAVKGLAITPHAAAVQNGGEQPKAPSKDAAKELFELTCGGCHSVDLVTSEHHSKEEWTATVQSMVDKGAFLKKEDTPTLIDYLTATYGPKK